MELWQLCKIQNMTHSKSSKQISFLRILKLYVNSVISWSNCLSNWFVLSDFHFIIFYLVQFTIYEILKERRVSTLRSFYPFSWEEQGRQNGIWSKLLIKIDFMVLQLLLTTAQVATFALDTVQDFLIKLGIKTCMHLWEISLFSLNIVILRPTKIMNRADKNCAHF